MGLALARGRALTAARVGWVLSQRAADWHVENGHLAALREHRPVTPTYLDFARVAGRLDGAWNLIVPENLPAMLAEVP